ncbi:MAG: hypothetical protein ACP5ID_03815 [Conexivisphaera sp.]
MHEALAVDAEGLIEGHAQGLREEVVPYLVRGIAALEIPGEEHGGRGAQDDH